MPLHFHGIIHSDYMVVVIVSQLTVVVVIALVQYTSVNGLWVPEKILILSTFKFGEICVVVAADGPENDIRDIGNGGDDDNRGKH